jgi:uncharacterized membrane protein YphA (DoxX/SURF4 family)
MQSYVVGAITLAVGISLLAGLLTPIAAGVIALRATAALLLIHPVFGLSLFNSRPSIAFLAAVAGAIILLGPGSFSVDSRLFGLREIIIPQRRTADITSESYAEGVRSVANLS